LEIIAERQKELRLALLGMEAQVERLLEENKETQGALSSVWRLIRGYLLQRAKINPRILNSIVTSI